MKILILSIRSHGEEDSVYVFGNTDGKDANILPVVKDWLSENGEELNIPDHVTDTASFKDWYRKEEDIDHVFIGTQVKELL